MHLFRWRSRANAQTPVVTTTSPRPPLREFVAKAEEILENFQELEMQLTSENIQAQSIKPPVEPCPSRRVRRRLTTYGEKDDGHGLQSCAHKPRKDRTSSAFDSFCERLLLMNRIWKQEREMKMLRASLESKKRSTTATAFKTFCDQLLLWNRIWKLEKAVKSMVMESEKMKRSRVLAITRAAKQMVLDVQKERLVEEFVKDLIKEVEQSKRDMKNLREAYETEIEEMNEDWVKDYRAILRELDALKLAQQSRLLEQEIANDEEDSLYANLLAGKRRVEELENKISEYERHDYASSSDDTVVASTSRRYNTMCENDDESTDVELDVISETSTSSTCVSVGRDSTRTAKIIPTAHRRRCISLRSPHEGRHVTASKPAFDHAHSTVVLQSNISAATRANHSGRLIAFRNRTTSSISLTSPGSGIRENSSGAAVKRAPWR